MDCSYKMVRSPQTPKLPQIIDDDDDLSVNSSSMNVSGRNSDSDSLTPVSVRDMVKRFNLVAQAQSPLAPRLSQSQLFTPKNNNAAAYGLNKFGSHTNVNQFINSPLKADTFIDTFKTKKYCCSTSNIKICESCSRFSNKKNFSSNSDVGNESERNDLSDHNDSFERNIRQERQERTEHNERTGRDDRIEWIERVERVERIEHNEPNEHNDRNDKIYVNDHTQTTYRYSTGEIPPVKKCGSGKASAAKPNTTEERNPRLNSGEVGDGKDSSLTRKAIVPKENNYLQTIDSSEDMNCQAIETSYQSKTTIAKTTSGVRIIIDIFFDPEHNVAPGNVVGSRVETDIPQSRILSEFQQQMASAYTQ